MNKIGLGIIGIVVVVVIIAVIAGFLLYKPSSETYCTKNGTNSKLALSEAKSIATNTECANLSATNENWCDEERGLWRLGLNVSAVENCFGAECLVNVETKQAEILWMCGGLIPPPTPAVYNFSCIDSDTNKSLTLANALELAENSECNEGLFAAYYSEVKVGTPGGGPGTIDTSSLGTYAICDSSQGAWWIRLNDFQQGCIQTLCLVDIDSNAARVFASCLSQ